MTITSSTCVRCEAEIRTLAVLQRASIAVSILFVMSVTGLLGLMWRAVAAQVHDPLIAAVLVGTITLSFLLFAVRMLTPSTWPEPRGRLRPESSNEIEKQARSKRRGVRGRSPSLGAPDIAPNPGSPSATV